MKIYPTTFEAYHEMDEPLFKVEMKDEECAEVTISTVVNAELWDEIAPAIRRCLVLGKDGLDELSK